MGIIIAIQGHLQDQKVNSKVKMYKIIFFMIKYS